MDSQAEQLLSTLAGRLNALEEVCTLHIAMHPNPAQFAETLRLSVARYEALSKDNPVTRGLREGALMTLNAAINAAETLALLGERGRSEGRPQ